MAFADEPLQLDATVPAAHWNARIRVDRLGLFKAVWGLTKAYLAGDPPPGSTSNSLYPAAKERAELGVYV